MKLILLFLWTPIFLFSQYGVLDETFGEGGIVHNIDLPADFINPHFVSIEIDANENIFVLGNYDTEFNPNHGFWDNGIFLAKYLPNGILDTSFGENGFQRFFIEGYSILTNDFILTSDGSFLIPVSGVFLEAIDVYSSFVIKVDTGGDYVPEFAEAGVYHNTFCECFPQKIIELEDGNYLLAEKYDGLWGPEGILLLKLSNTGQPVVSFGNNGRKIIWQPNPENFIKYVDFTIDENNEIYVLSLIQDGTHRLYKLDINGSEDLIMPLTDSSKKSHSLVCSEGDLYISGSYNGQFFFLEHYFSEDLNLDVNFGNAGTKFTDFDLNNEVSTKLLLSNRLYQTGYAGDSTNGYKFAIASHKLNGTTDNSFGQEGKVITDITESMFDVSSDSEFMGENKIIVLNYNSLSMACYTIFNILEVEEISPNTKIQIAPNPASNSFFINGLKGNNNQIRIFDLSGKLIQEFNSVQNNQRIELGTISKGTYIVEIISKNIIETKKLMVK